MDWAARSLELVWAASLAAVPVAMIAAVCCRWRGMRPATRHALWFAVLATLLSPIVVAAWRPAWFRSERVLAAADTAVETVMQSARTAKSAYVALAPLDRVSTLEDQPSPSVPVVVDPPRTAPEIVVNQAGSRARRSDYQPARTDVAPAYGALARGEAKGEQRERPGGVARSTGAGRPVSARAAREVVGPMPFAQSALGVEELTRIVPEAGAVEVETAGVGPEGLGGGERVSVWSQVRDWLGHILAVRDALAAVPGIPPAVWLGGAGVILAAWLVRLVRVRRMLGRAEAAPEPVVALVRRLAAVAGVKRVPETVVVEDRISPMIWCGLRPRLVIPRGLWSELDARCQCAVIVHELSHLRRRDHRMCVVEALVGLVYWWHPVAWWARRRLRDEAEACCDAWVTTLLPGGRRAYAEALVVTKSFLSVPGRSGAPGLGVVSGRTRQLARRITMVMTQRVAPRSSMMGMAFALAVGAAGMLVMPGLACPPEDEKPSAQAKAVSKEKEAKRRAEAQSPKVVQGQAFFGEAPALEAMRAGKARTVEGQPLDGQMGALKDMERSLQQMEQRLKEMQRRLETMQSRDVRPRSEGSGRAQAPRAVAGLMGQQPAVVAPRAGQATAPSVNVLGVTTAGPTEAKSYTLPKGKLDALVALMARDDVPIFISSDGQSITVNATAAQHRVFQAFVGMIHPDGRQGQALQTDQLIREHALAGQHAAAVHRDAVRAHAEQLRAQARGLAQQRSAMTRQSEQLKREIDRARREAERAMKRAKDESEAESVEDAMERDIEALESQIEVIDQACEGFDSQIESIEEAIESLTEAAEHSAMPALAPTAPAMPGAGRPAMPVSTPPAPPAAPTPGAAPVAPVAPAPAAAPAPATAPAPAVAPAPPAPPAVGGVSTAAAPRAAR